MNSHNTKSDFEKSLNKIASYFCSKTPKMISFADADNYEYEISLIVKSWNESFPSEPFEKAFPFIDELWKTLGSWNYGDDWDRKKCERIIELAKKHLEVKKSE